MTSFSLRLMLRSVSLLLVSCYLLLLCSCATLPGPSASGKASSSSPSGVRTIGRQEQIALINVNTASVVELEKLPGIGKVLAERIVAQREQYGPFRRPEHLMMVRGMSDQKFRDIRSLLTVE